VPGSSDIIWGARIIQTREAFKGSSRTAADREKDRLDQPMAGTRGPVGDIE
jgi:hypothetical protein